MSQFFTPEHIHVMIIHFPIAGTILAMIPLLLGLFLKNATMKLTGLIILIVSLAALPITMETGEESEERFERGQVGVELDAAGERYMHQHAEQAETVSVIGYGLLVLCLVQLFFIYKKRETAISRTYIAIILINLILIGGLGWVANTGGKIRHPEFREEVSQV